MATYRTPDVYIEEISTLPPSVAEVSTAIPAFLGYTESATDADGNDLTLVPTRINTLLDYTALFGGPDTIAFNATANADNQLVALTKGTDSQHNLYYSLDHYFKNGGGSCYIVSLGKYKAKTKEDFEKGLKALEKEDELTLIVLSEATSLGNPKDYYDLCQAALDQCEKLKDRFCILDVLNTDTRATAFRSGITNNLKYGAAYFPFLNTSINYRYEEKDVKITWSGNNSASTRSFTFSNSVIKLTYKGAINAAPSVEILAGNGSSNLTFALSGDKLTINNVGSTGKDGSKVAAAWDTWTDADTSGFDLTVLDQSGKLTALALTSLTAEPVDTATTTKTLVEIRDSYTSLYNAIKAELTKQRVTLPPSPAVAGVYATVDRTRGVWKAPANVGLNNVISPAVKITAEEQESLNVDAGSGKSVNAIRSFVGKGTLIWGSRTLAGNDNEWRYVPVRRLFNMIEESAKKASAFAVFEPNDASTWLKVKGMLDSYLYGLWQQGALAGSKPDAAYYVHVGLGKTMTTQDVLEGRMIIEIGIAAVRPAEFIILRFSHKLQEA